jgi:TPR repeat protein
MFQGHIETDTAMPVEAAVYADVLFNLGMLHASGRNGAVDLVAAHKWFNLAAVRGHHDAISHRREISELMSEIEIAMAQRDARTWMASH